MAWYSDVHFKHQAFVEFFVAEKESVTIIHKQLKNVYSGKAVDKSTLSHWAS
jgi:hypothetical protein